MKNSLKSLYILVVIFLVSIPMAMAQRKAPGYMGKRVLLKYDQGISWSFGGDARAVPNFIYTLQSDVALTTKISLGAEYSFMTRKYNKYVGDPSYYGSSSYDEYVLNRTYMHKAGIYVKLFSQSNGHIAPAGPFFLVGMNFFFVQGKYSVYNNSQLFGVPRAESIVSFDFGPSIGGGKQYIVANRMVISLDVRLTLPLIGFARSMNNLADIESPETFAQARSLHLNRTTLWPNAQANILMVRIGLGTLL